MWPTHPRMAMPKMWRRRGRIARSTGQLAGGRHPPNRSAIAFYEKELFEPWVAPQLAGLVAAAGVRC